MALNFTAYEAWNEDNMKIDYDPEADAMYIRLRAGDIDDTLVVGKYVFVDIDSAGVPLGLEILFAGRTLAAEDITSVTVNIGRSVQPSLEPS
jgi:uncharacterized protein YuzE